MPIVQFPDRNVIPRVAKLFAYYNTTAATGVYYTTVNSTGVRGRLTKITMSGGANASNQTIRITIDGVQASVSPSLTATGAVVGLPHNANGSSINEATYSFDYYCDITFTNSIQVEFMQNWVASTTIIGNVMYSQEQV